MAERGSLVSGPSSAATHSSANGMQYSRLSNGSASQPPHLTLKHESENLPATSKEAPAPKSTWSDYWIRNWKTLSLIIGFLVAAVICAVGHYVLFDALDGDIVDHGTLSQSQVTVVSLLLVTLFKASLSASLAACFAQHLWRILRGGATSISTIEKLFTLRTNLIALGDWRAVGRAPLLFAMALLVWCLGLATIYPPGALTIELKPFTFVETRNISIMNPLPPSDFNPFMADALIQYPTMSLNKSWKGRPADADKSLYLEYFWPSQPILNVAKSVVNNNQGLQSLSSTGENSSYHLEFRAPQFRCSTSSSNATEALSGSMVSMNTVETWWHGANFTFKQQHIVEFYTPQLEESPFGSEATVDTETLVCYPFSVLHKVNITYPKGVQSYVRTTDDWQPLEYPEKEFWASNPEYGKTIIDKEMDPWPWPESKRDMESYPESAKLFARDVSAILPRFNEFAILDSFLLQARIHAVENVFLDTCDEGFNLENGTHAFRCTWNETLRSGFQNPDDYAKINIFAQEFFQGTIFDFTTFNKSDLSQLKYGTKGSYIVMTEALLNEALTNISISALSLGTWWSLTPVSFIRNQNTYKFSHPLNLILPYSICLGLGTFFSIVALWALWQNGDTASDGGFAQVMLATRGDTEMERLVVQEGCTSVDHMSKDLAQLRLRYGQLTVGQQGEVDETRLGFGTVDETISLLRTYKQ